VRELPELFDRRVKARSLAYLFLATAAVAVLTVLLPHNPAVNDLALLLVASAALAVAGIVLLRSLRLTDLEVHLALAAATALLTLANYWVESTALYPILYSWVALYAFYFFQWQYALAHVTWIAVSYTVLLSVQDPGSAAVRWLLTVVTPAVAGFLISRLLGVVRAEAVRSADHARALSESESRMRLILESAPDAFTATDRHGIVIAWNAAAERLFGWSASEAIGRPLRGLVVPPEGQAAHDERRERMLAAPDPVAVERHEIELERRDGTRFPAEKTISKMVVGDEVILSIFVRDVGERRRREEQREALLREQAAREEAERVAEMVSGMQLLVDAALAHRTLDDILADLLPRVRGVLGADAATVFLVEDRGRLVLAASTGGTEEHAPVSVEFGEGFAGRLAEERTPMLAHDPPTGDIADPTIRHLPVGSLIGVPLMARDQVTGVIVAAVGAPRKFTDQDLGTLRLAADRVALAIDHARVYEREHRIAETLQRSLLPERLPRLPGLAVAARYRPAAAEAEVGGDWYDVIPIPGGRVGLVMGDVAGKGLAAASMVGRLRSALRAYALEGHGAGLVIERLNRLVWTELQESQMATLIYVVLDPADGTLRWVNAGHLPPLVLGSDRTPKFLEGGRSVPLGVLPFPSFQEVEFRLEPGGTVVLYTDGLVERPGEHIDAGLAKLAGEVRAAPAAPEALCDHLLAAMVPERGAQDDVAILALQNIPVGDEFSVELPAEPEALAAMRGLLRRWLVHAEGTDQEIAEITTACGEAATNAIEHAGSGGGAPFEVTGTVAEGEVDITVRDYGAWRAPRDGDQGRGLSLMRALMDSVDVDPGQEGTSVRLRRRLNGDEPAV
jgi:PAS domain S-box-containing protein